MGNLVHQAYVEQTLWDGIFLRILVYVLASSTGIRISQSSLRRGYRDNGESWSGQAQAFDLFDFAWDAQ
jgi:hypothetical protein